MVGFTFVLVEKPQAAARIAYALANRRPTQKRFRGLPYYEVDWKNQHLVIAPAIGHLYGVAQEKRGSGWPVFGITWKPLYEIDKTKSRLKPWIEALKTLGSSAESYISATDYDVEGSLIAYCILRYALNIELEQARRVKFSTMSKPELEDAFLHPQSSLDFGLIEAGRTRHELDWLFGINTSRALMSALRDAGLFEKLSAGRVQSPTLYELVKREAAIFSFVPTPYFTIEALAEIEGGTFPAYYELDKITTLREAAKVVEECHGQFGFINEIQVSERHVPPSPPFNLGTLQSEAYRHLHFTPSRSLRIAESLYLQALISYPRTDSQKLPPSIGYHAILDGLARSNEYASLITQLRHQAPILRPREGGMDDPAHPALYPTGNLPAGRLSSDGQRLLDMIIRRFLAAFSIPYIKQQTQLSIKVGEHNFTAYGSRLLEEGWLRYYHPYSSVEEYTLPTITKGQDAFMKSVQYSEKYTQPLNRYNSSSLLRFMERQQIGTKATRAETIDTLLRRGYVKSEPLHVTDLGWATAEALRRSFRELLSTELTRHFEQILSEIESGRKTREEALDEAETFLRAVYRKFAASSTQTSAELATAVRDARRKRKVLGACPVCKLGELRILTSGRTGKRFVGCSRYFEGACKYTAPLPQRGTLEPLQRNCPTCGYPTVRVRFYRRRAWILCINTECPKKAGWRKNEVPNLPKTSQA
jgi:DNA topoisomerase I